jgi:hypothetical protein
MLKGDLTSTPLAHLLRDLAGDSATGCLHVTNPAGDEALIYFKTGLIYSVSVPGTRPQLGAKLVSSGALAPEALAEALEAQRSELQGWRLGELLVHLGYVDQPVVEAFVMEQTTEALWDLLRWSDGRWKFRKNIRAREDIGPPMVVVELLATLRDRGYEWENISAVVHGPAAVPMLSASGGGSAETTLDNDAWSMLCKIDGERSVADLARDCGYTLFEAGQVIVQLVQAGLVDIDEDLDLSGSELYGATTLTSALAGDLDESRAAEEAEEAAAIAAAKAADDANEDVLSRLARLVNEVAGDHSQDEGTNGYQPAVEDEPAAARAESAPTVALAPPLTSGVTSFDNPMIVPLHRHSNESFATSIARVSNALSDVLGETPDTTEQETSTASKPVALKRSKSSTSDPEWQRRKRLRSAAAAELASAQAMVETLRADQDATGTRDAVETVPVEIPAETEQDEGAQQAEAERIAAEQAEAERLAAEQAELERIAAEQAELERLAAEQAELERIAAEQAEAERLAAEQAELERIAAEEAATQAEAERLVAEQAELERIAAEEAEAERLAAEQAELERLAAEQAELERLAAEQAEAERLAAEQAELERIAAEEAAAQAEAERLAAEQAELERLAAEQAELERIAAEQAEAERLAAEQAELERIAAEEAEAERLAAEQAELERIAAEEAEAERLAAEQAELEHLAAEEAERLAAEEAERAALEELAWAEYWQREGEARAAEQAELERIAANQAELERIAAEEAEAERLAAEEAERLAAEEAAQFEAEAEQAEADRLAAEEAAQLAAAEAEAEAAPVAEAERFEAEQEIIATASGKEERAARRRAERQAAEDAANEADDAAAATALLIELAATEASEEAPAEIAAATDDEPAEDATPAEPEAVEEAWDEAGQADTAALLRELSSLGIDDDEPSAPTATQRPRQQAPADKKQKKKIGLFGL